jgi:hypothetical protein
LSARRGCSRQVTTLAIVVVPVAATVGAIVGYGILLVKQLNEDRQGSSPLRLNETDQRVTRISQQCTGIGR